jgi:predicted glycosyltransferase
VDRLDPDVIVVDRHPYGTFGELREGLELGHRRGSRIVIGLRDIIDDRETVAAELAGARWDGVDELFDEAFVYGERHLCDHEAEYGLRIAPRYCGWVVDMPIRVRREPRLLAVAAGGGGDGRPVWRLAAEVVAMRRDWTAVLAAGPFADALPMSARERRALGDRLTVAFNLNGCARLFARAGAVLQMAGYNSTYEALAAGHRPILAPRRTPRREQEIRALRLADLGLADVVPEAAGADWVVPLLDADRVVTPAALRAAGIALDGADRAAARLLELARRRRPAGVPAHSATHRADMARARRLGPGISLPDVSAAGAR